MANEIKGEYAMDVEGQAYTLVLDANGFCEFEAVTGEKAFETLALPGQLSMTHMRAFMWAALRRHHKQMSLEDAGALVSLLGPAKADAHLGAAIMLAWPKSGDTPPPNPRKAPVKKPAKKPTTVGTGSASTDAG